MNAQSSRLPMPWDEVRRCLDDRDTPASFDRLYFYHLAWAARILAERRPVRHVDISSQNLFVATVSAFLPIESYEFHPLPVELSNLKAGKADLCQLPFPDHSVPSVSCMHAVEHVGLGRYGDRLDPDGDLKAMGELRRVLAPGGQLLFVVPVGRPRVVFNAHRIYPYEQICEAFGDLELKEFALIPDDATRGHLLRHADPGLVQQQVYACGCFHFVEARARPSTANTQE
jgi:SAM-dependent methyltransferase